MKDEEKTRPNPRYLGSNPIALFATNRPIAALLVVLGLSACVDFVPHHDYPSEYPAASLTGACPDLSGTFENIGTQLGKTNAATHSIGLSDLTLGSGVVPSRAQISALQISGPAQGVLRIEALTPEGATARSSIPSAPKADGFAHAKPFSTFVCDVYQGGGTVVLTNEPVTIDGTKYNVVVRIYRAKDGSLVVARQEVNWDFLGEANVWNKWFRFRQIAQAP